MALTDHLASDLDMMFADWGDSITIGATDYAGLYDAVQMDAMGMVGYAPAFLGRSDQLTAAVAAQGTSVTITSPLAGITTKAFTIATREDQRDGTVKLILEEQ